MKVSTVSPTLAVNEEVARRRAAGLPTVPLGFGEAGIPVHPLLTTALGEAAPAAGYGPPAGIPELREAAAGYWTRRGVPADAGDVVAAPGSKALLWAVLGAAGGGVALPKPSWVSYAAQAALHGLPCHLVPGAAGVPDPDRLDALGPELGTVVLTLPDNPTGAVASPEAVRAVCEIAERHDLLILSDEIYRDLVHDAATPFLSPAEVAPERTVVTTGLSKNLALGGWRIGVARFPSRSLRDAVIGIGSEVWSAPAQPVQKVAALAFTEPAALRDRIEASRRLHSRVAHAVARILTGAGVACAPPQAGFYLYPDFTGWAVPDDRELAARLLDLGVATLPGSAFGDDPGALRLRIATSLLYGENDEQRHAALASDDPASLPWITAQLDRVEEALSSARERFGPSLG
ncbi:pyridoxal phosphate-dependent aminotransferase [Amycolatopsis sp. 195334CR]|uniref:pyridoxal phosphate-dependent aminotransferase n=1 Tax=Amycolatopsis sp. 195334CR TaxID=2814588 RepID=UPI001A8F66DC|nr:pyridoxal phosphate-dependent aminotransferase [Amycolatopsis sp. 195334CR]MBN6039864.1 pyridoxal phosphate-dependent aminotransferase [Amycolatopsis sp. 195334CR]